MTNAVQQVYPTYLRSYGMTVSDALLFLFSFIVTYNFTSMQTAMTPTGLALGFYGGIAVLGWFYQILFMPETKVSYHYNQSQSRPIYPFRTTALTSSNIADTSVL